MIELIDDLDGSAATQTVTFALDGASYEVDLSDANADELRAALAPFVGRGRRTGGRKQAASGVRAGGPNTKDIRSWAVRQGVEVNLRGRIPEAVIQQYLAAN